MFVDKALVHIAGGKGGDGMVSFRREKFIDRGGPDGGDGGDGGSVIVIGSQNQNSLASFRYQKELKAEFGSAGFKRKQHGKSGKDLRVLVPVGTVVTREEGLLLADIITDRQEVLIAKGGKGGFGNTHFVSSRRRSPRVAEKGEPGEAYSATLELKMLADVGLIGLPNAGKSTLLKRLTNAQPEIANYPFTTIKPNIGVADIDESTSVLIADIPGLIEGASTGKGLGDEFLRHVERTKVLVHLIDIYNEDLPVSYNTIRKELADYKVDLSKRPEIVAINKIDGFDQEIVDDRIKQLQKAVPKSTKIMAISAASGTGTKELLSAIVKLNSKKQPSKKPEAKSIPLIKLSGPDESWSVHKTKQGFMVTGPKIERFAQRTDFDNFAGIDRLRDIMRKKGIMHELERRGIEPGQKIAFGKSKIGKLEY